MLLWNGTGQGECDMPITRVVTKKTRYLWKCVFSAFFKQITSERILLETTFLAFKLFIWPTKNWRKVPYRMTRATQKNVLVRINFSSFVEDICISTHRLLWSTYRIPLVQCHLKVIYYVPTRGGGSTFCCQFVGYSCRLVHALQVGGVEPRELS